MISLLCRTTSQYNIAQQEIIFCVDGPYCTYYTSASHCYVCSTLAKALCAYVASKNILRLTWHHSPSGFSVHCLVPMPDNFREASLLSRSSRVPQTHCFHIRNSHSLTEAEEAMKSSAREELKIKRIFFVFLLLCPSRVIADAVDGGWWCWFCRRACAGTPT
jgi:hypothetical protein